MLEAPSLLPSGYLMAGTLLFLGGVGIIPRKCYLHSSIREGTKSNDMELSRMKKSYSGITRLCNQSNKS